MDDAGFIRPEAAVIGGRGRMGRWLSGFLEDRGFDVVTVERGDPPAAFCRAARRHVVILAVPLTEIDAVMGRIGPHTRPEGVVLDVCSLKAGPLAAMTAHARGEVVGLHPLFGPATPSLNGQTVVFCPGRGRVWPERVRTWLARQGARVVEMEPPRHDQLMAVVQTLRHLMLGALGGSLRELGFDLKRDLPLAGEWFPALIDMLAGQCGQPPALFADIAASNPASLETLQTFRRRLDSLIAPLAAGDREGLATELGRAWDYMAPWSGEGSGPRSGQYHIHRRPPPGRSVPGR